jgi:uncharacterized RDD family membrane protein YckC
MTQPSGWYEDPQDINQLRYWDGVVWSDHVTPKVSPTVAQSNIGMPHSVTPAAARPEGSGSHGAQGTPLAPGGYPQQGQGQQGGQWQAQGQGPGQPVPQMQGWQSHPSTTTPDGVELSGWWLRVGARLLDDLFTFVLALPFTGWFFIQYVRTARDWVRDVADQTAVGSGPVLVFPPWEVLRWLFAAAIIGYLISGVYEVLFLHHSGATPGKKIVGISVRLRDRAGPLPMKTALGRTACYLGFRLVSIANLLDILWPLWDDKKQALHDKAVGTNVVIGPQPGRDT